MPRNGRDRPDDDRRLHDRLDALGLGRSEDDASAGWVPASPSTRPPSGPGSDRRAVDWLRDRVPVTVHPALDRWGLARPLGILVAIAVAVAIVLIVVHGRSGGGVVTAYSSEAPPSPSWEASSGSSPDPYASALSSAVTDPTSIVVDVGGRVRKPGLVTLPQGARVADAIDAAGGPVHRRELVRVDLAARVSDGQLLLVGVGSVPAGGADGSAPSASPSPVPLNSASLDELETLPGVGPVTAQKIIDWRTAHGGFTSVEQLQQVSGIGPARYAELSPLVTP